MGDCGEMIVRSLHAESVKSREEIVSLNEAEYKRCLLSRKVWETRLQNSPLDKKLQDFVAYHQDVVERFEQWFASEGIALPSMPGSVGPANGISRVDRSDRA